MNGNRVVVTGLGAVTPVGLDVASSWQAICDGKSGAASIESFNTDAFSTQFSCSVKDFSTEGYLAPKDSKRMDPFIQFGMVAGIQAIRDSGLEVTDANCERIGCAIGSGIGGIGSIERNNELILNSGPRRMSPFFVPGAIINMISGNLSVMYNLHGPNLAIVTACTSGTHNIGMGARLIATGEVDTCYLRCTNGDHASWIKGICCCTALSTRNASPELASRPWDADRDGFVLGDGAAMLMLESLDSAKARKAHIYAELTGFGMSGDAYHMTSPPEDGRGAARSMANALRDSGLNAADVGYINAHGTSTMVGDRAETMAVKSIFGHVAPDLAVSSTKSMIGHLLGAAGAVEAVFTILAIRDGVAPPTINLDNPGEGCDLNYVPHNAQQRKITHAMSNSFGFGGTNGTLVFSQFSA